MESIIAPKGDGHPARKIALPTPDSFQHDLQAVEILARVLLGRIASLRAADSDDTINLAAEVERFEAALISAALVETRGRQRRAAQLLGMNITTLNRKLKRYKIKSRQQVNNFERLESEVEHLS